MITYRLIRNRFFVLHGFWCVICTTLTLSLQAGPVGLPFARFHSLDDIGNISAGIQIGFDQIGRVSIVQNGTYAVLNDNTWIHLTERDPDADTMMQIVQTSADSSYYGATGSWGKVVKTEEGKLTPIKLSPSVRPVWTQSNDFLRILPEKDGIYFASWNGVVHWNKLTDKHTFFEIPDLVGSFILEDKLFVSSGIMGLVQVDLKSGSLQLIDTTSVGTPKIFNFSKFPDNRILCSARHLGLFVFNGKTLSPWKSDLDQLDSLTVSTVCRLANDKFAIAVDSVGLFIVSAEGSIIKSFTSPNYHGIQNIISREPNILWFSTDLGIQQVFYGSNASIIDKRLGLPVNWPQVVTFKGETLIASNGRLYSAKQEHSTSTTRFELIPNQPKSDIWAIGSMGDHLLVGNNDGVFERIGETEFVPILSDFVTDRIVMVSADLCYVIGREKITALKFESGRWKEITDRVAGFGYPSVVHRAKNSAWIELGRNRVARITLENEKLQTQLFDQFPWDEPRWIHIGVIGNTVILNGPEKGRVYFNELTGAFCEPPDEIRLFENVPFWIGRIIEDSSGTIWASHDRGLLKWIKKGSNYTLDLSISDFIRDRFSIIRVVENDNVWIASASMLYHCEPTSGKPANIHLKPILESIVNTRTGKQITTSFKVKDPIRLDYSQNSLTFRFFAGTYSLRNPRYEIQMEGPFSNWSIRDAESLLTLPNLREGHYQLKFQLTDNGQSIGIPTHVTFEIKPPWFRTIYAYFIYGIVAFAIIYIVITWLLHRTRNQNKLLARLVKERTEKLEVTMQKLNQETRNAATLAERGRLAGEIHDSLQQGLTGLILHLDATLKLSKMNEEIRSRLKTARKMISFTRQEVQHAVWDMESPLLDNSDLGEAIQRIANLIDPNSAKIQIHVFGVAQTISSTKTHHLLRIAQEAITNAVRHGAAKSINIQIAYLPDSVSLTIIDDGCGFDPQVAMNLSGHFGLRGIRNRSKAIGSNLKVDSKSGYGTTIKVMVPLVEESVSPPPIRCSLVQKK